ncbi:Carboxylesterase NlhH [Stieleria maiorica]|uniref:Carboxylesterase NlhH n=1 Tax=Stieleria maiorica TaxID=2795974 RepID=A0A5B9MAL6_9BACT|nr:alpha/beta hydrolase [Stieleria maiorica]QEF97723.1 Carboxylesterase NlhH [Stieleria maiorica]
MKPFSFHTPRLRDAASAVLLTVGLFAVAIETAAAQDSSPQNTAAQVTAAQVTAAQVTAAQVTAPDGVEVLSDIQYATTPHGPLLLDLYRPEQIDRNLPVIVFVHGGGWKGGDKRSGLKIAAWLAGENYAVASINYRLLEVSAWPTQIDDCYAAVRWVREHAEQYRFDPDRIVAWGTSAGGHLAALMATRPYPGNESTSSRVHAGIDWFGPTDLLTMPPNVVSQSRSFEDVAKSNGARLLQAPVMTVPELAKTASALYNVTPDDPPMLIMHGDQDPGVPVDQSVRLAEALKKAGVPVQLEIIPGAGHGGKAFQTPEVRAAVRRFLKEHLQ